MVKPVAHSRYPLTMVDRILPWLVPHICRCCAVWSVGMAAQVGCVSCGTVLHSIRPSAFLTPTTQAIVLVEDLACLGSNTTL